MARINLEGLRARDIRHGPGFQFQSMTVVNADNMLLDINAPTLIFLNPAGAVDLLLPDSTAVRKGIVFIFVNLSANIVTLKTSGDAVMVPAITVAAAAAGAGATRIVCTGSTTLNAGWAIW